MFFGEIPGQEEIKKNLVKSVNEGRISHAQMFYGPEGSGKLALALAYATYISCTDRQEDDACGKCPSCIKYKKLVHPDLHFLYPCVSSSTESTTDKFLDNWRTEIQDNVFMDQNHWYGKIGLESKQGIITTKDSDQVIRKLNLKSYESNYKIMIIWLPEKMNAQAANKLLKLIEEPPPGTIFILVTESPEDIIATIRSRTQTIKVPRLRDIDIAQALKKMNINEELISDAVHVANGNFNKALTSIKSDELNKYNFEKFVSLMRLCYGKKIPEIIDLIDDLAGKGRENQKLFLAYSSRMLRENFMVNIKKNDLTHMAANEEEFSIKFSIFINKNNILQLYEEFNLAYNHISANGFARIVLFDLSLKIIRLLHL